jgi:hypothetical protein
MNGLFGKCLVVLLALGVISSALAAQEPPHGLEIEDKPRVVPRLDQPEGKEDPPGLLNKHGIESFRQVARELSSDRRWLTSEVLESLGTMRLSLDEIFTEAPSFLEVDQSLYRIVLEKAGSGWDDFGPKSKYLVFLNHEAYDGLGEDHALAFENGRERTISAEDLKKTPAISLTLQGITPDEQPRHRHGVIGLESTIHLGQARPQVRSTRRYAIGKLLAANETTQSCSYISAPTSCSNGVPVCASATATPYFLVSGIRIRIDREGTFKGDPEAELFPFRINPNSPYGGSTDVRTNWIFSGRYVTDTAGRSVYLPNVNNTWQWYSIYDGVAVFPSNLSNEWVGTLVENDDTTGKLEIDRNKSNLIKLPVGAVIAQIFDGLDFLKGFNLVVSLGFLNDSDDLWQPSLAIDNNLFCSSGVGQPFPYTYTLYGEEWDMQGHFACIDPACVPDPCGGDPCCGDPCCGDPYCGGGCGSGGQICP